MQVNFNNVRKQACFSLDKLIKTLKRSIRKSDNLIDVPVEAIEKDLNNLRNAVITIACTYEDDAPDFKDLSEEIGEISWLEEEE